MSIVPTLPSGVIGVSIYPGDRPMFGASLDEALAYARSCVADGFPEPLMLGAMRPAHLGREVVTLADLLDVLCPCGKAIEHTNAPEGSEDDACRVPVVSVR